MFALRVRTSAYNCCMLAIGSNKVKPAQTRIHFFTRCIQSCCHSNAFVVASSRQLNFARYNFKLEGAILAMSPPFSRKLFN